MDFTLCLTHACNLRCGYCYAGKKRAESMTWETARRAIDYCLAYTCAQPRSPTGLATVQMGFFGGEPLMEWELLCRAHDHAASEAARLGIRLTKTVTTNMTLLDKRKASWLRQNGFWVGLSIDGHAGMHDSMRRFADGRGSHAQCAPALDDFRGRQANGEVIVVLDPQNVHHAVEAVAWLIRQEMVHISLNPNFSTEWTESAQDQWRASYEGIADLYAESFRQGKPVRVNVIDSKIRTRVKGGYAACDKCGFGKNEVAISVRGNFYPCERSVGDDDDESIRIGNVAAGFDEAKRLSLVSQRGNVVTECDGCHLRPRCMNWCSCINLATTGAINRVSGEVCFHEKISIAAADRVAARLFEEQNHDFLARFYAV